MQLSKAPFKFLALSLLLHTLPFFTLFLRPQWLPLSNTGSGAHGALQVKVIPAPAASPARSARKASPAPWRPAQQVRQDMGVSAINEGGPVISDNVEGLRVRNWQEPAYPEAARQAGAEGRVVIEIEVYADGQPANLRLVQSSGHPALDEAARAALRRAQFTLPPGVSSARTSVALNFHLR